MQQDMVNQINQQESSWKYADHSNIITNIAPPIQNLEVGKVQGKKSIMEIGEI